MPNHNVTDKRDKLHGSVEREIVGQLLNNTPTAAGVNIAIALLTYLAIPSPSLLWLWLLLGISLLRFVPLLPARIAEASKRHDKQIYLSVLATVLLQGSAWGFAAVTLFSSTPDLYRMYLIAIICGMVGGAIMTLTPSLAAYMCFALPSVLPLITVMLMEMEPIYLYAALMGSVYLMAVILLARKIDRNHLDLLVSGRRLEATSAELLRHKKRLEQLVDERTRELRKSRETYRRLIEEINDVLYELDKNGTIRYISPAVVSLVGYSPDDLIGGQLLESIAPEDRPQVEEEIPAIMAGTARPLEYRMLDKHGRPHWVRNSSRPIMDDGRFIGLRGVLTSIDAEKQAEQEKLDLLRKIGEIQKLEALGTMAGGIAHDFNNLLMAIQGRAAMISFNLEPADPAAEHVQAIEEYVRSAASLTDQLLGAARGGKYDPRPTDLNNLVARSARMFIRTRKEIHLELLQAETPAVAEVDGNQIEQVLLNMFVNAWQAMPEGGTLRVQVANTVLDRDFCFPYGIEPGRYARITVSDTGSGIDREILDRVFDPFFTTKDKGRGTGLGLASAHGIVRNHHGCITVESEQGRGTTFQIFLPRADLEPQPALLAQQHLVRGTETILLVDDEEMILEVGRAILEQLGYRVLVARGGAEAIEQIRDHGESIQLVLLDMIMPGLDGGRTFDALRQLDPQLPVILSSGYSLSDQAAEILQRGCNGFIQKPFSIPELSRKIRSVLDA